MSKNPNNNIKKKKTAKSKRTLSKYNITQWRTFPLTPDAATQLAQDIYDNVIKDTNIITLHSALKHKSIPAATWYAWTHSFDGVSYIHKQIIEELVDRRAIRAMEKTYDGNFVWRFTSLECKRYAELPMAERMQKQAEDVALLKEFSKEKARLESLENIATKPIAVSDKIIDSSNEEDNNETI